jgi:hypothetical protein
MIASMMAFDLQTLLGNMMNFKPLTIPLIPNQGAYLGLKLTHLTSPSFSMTSHGGTKVAGILPIKPPYISVCYWRRVA